MRLAAVTGGAGFLGRHLVRALAEDGWTVRVLIRRDPIHPLWRGFEPQVVCGALEDAGALARLCDGADVVIHAAGLIKARSRADFDQVNVAGADALARAADAKTPVILISTLAAREPQLSHYAASKRAGEEAMRARLGDRLTILRPTAVYGPGDEETLGLFQAAAKSPVLPVLSPDARLSLIHVFDAAAQIAAVAAAPFGGVAALCDDQPEGYGWDQVMTAAASAVGVTPSLVRLPDAVLRGLAQASRLLPSRGPPMLTPGKAREILHTDWSVAQGDRPPSRPPARYGLRDGFADTVRWYQEHGRLPKSRAG